MTVKEIVRADPDDEHSQNRNFETPLYLAATFDLTFALNDIDIFGTIVRYCTNPGVEGPEGRTSLHAAVINNSYTNVARIMRQIPSLYQRADNNGWTAFHWAASYDSHRSIVALIRTGNQDPYARRAVMAMTDYNHQTAQHIAASKGHINVLKKLTDYCPDVCETVDEDGRNILHIAAEQRHGELIQSILCDYPDVAPKLLNMQDKNGDTPLHLLASVGLFVPQLIQYRGVMAMTNANHKTAHHIAASKGHINVLKKLIDYCPDVCETVDEDCKNILHIAAEQRRGELIESILCDYPDLVAKLLHMQDKNGDTPLHLLVSADCFDFLPQLIQLKGVDPTLVNRDNMTAHHIAATGGYVNVLTILIKCCPDGCEIVDKDGRNILHIAAEQRRGELIESILCDYPDLVAKLLNMQDKNGDTPLHLLVSPGCFDFLPQLIQLKGVDPTLVNRDNMTAHHIAASGGHINVLKTLIKYCPDGCVTVDKDGRNILHIAAEQRHGELTESILCDYPDLVVKLLNMQDKNGDTPLHLFVSAGCFDFLPQLIQLKGVDPTLVNRDNMTAHHIAASGGYINVLTTLIKCCPDGCETVDKDNRNILHIAAKQRRGELIESILCDYPDLVAKLLNMQDKNEDTPLHLLVSAGCFDFLPQLIQLKGVDPTLRNKEKMTAQDHLYVEEEIVGDELRIRNAFVHIQAKNGQKYVRSQESSVLEYKRRRKDTKFEMANTKIMKDKVNLYRKRTNTQIIVTAFIATVTFTVGFTMPGGNYSGGDAKEGLAVLSRKTAFNVCMVANTIGLLFSASSLFLYFISSVYEDPHDVSKFIVVSTGFNIVSVVAMMLTFITGTYVVLSHSPVLAISLCAISCLFFLLVILLLIKWKYDPKEKFKLYP